MESVIVRWLHSGMVGQGRGPAMAAEDLLRLAWEADHDGRHALRDALLTLAIAESDPGDDWPERCRARLISERPGHYLGDYPSVRQALHDPRVIASRDRLRRKYPAERVRWLLLRAQAARGTYTGRVESLEAMIEDLAGVRAEAENVRLDAPESVRGPLSRVRVSRPVSFSLAYPPMAGRADQAVVTSQTRSTERVEVSSSQDSRDRRFHYYSILFAIAMLLATLPVDEESGPIAD
jgi:hypothetical protein